jgi:hypothetical protein
VGTSSLESGGVRDGDLGGLMAVSDTKGEVEGFGGGSAQFSPTERPRPTFGQPPLAQAQTMQTTAVTDTAANSGHTSTGGGGGSITATY